GRSPGRAARGGGRASARGGAGGTRAGMNDARQLLEAIESGAVGDPPTVLAWAAGRRLELPAEELNQALRRALLLLAAGGDPHRELGVDDRAVKALAVDLHTEE